jgi:hypothetical protein
MYGFKPYFSSVPPHDTPRLVRLLMPLTRNQAGDIIDHRTGSSEMNTPHIFLLIIVEEEPPDFTFLLLHVRGF